MAPRHLFARQRLAKQRRALGIESLEPRTLMAVAPLDDALLAGHGGACHCPVCTGVGIDQIPVVEAPPAPAAAAVSLAGLPQLSSNPAARAKLFLDFNGHFQASWGSFSNVLTPAFDQDGRPTSLSSGELATIRDVWARVAEDYAPFNIDVTTIAPGSQSAGAVAHVAIGGHYADWYGSSAGGVAYVGGFSNTLPSVAYVFAEALGNGNTRYVAEAASHEAGHLFGLQHQAVWSGGALVDAYNSGNGDWAPIMGTGYYATRTTWHRGTSSTGASAIQDDMTILAGRLGWRPDDVGSTPATATSLSGTSVNLTGLIGSPSDVDLWSFTTAGGSIHLQLGGVTGGNLDAVLEVRDAAGRAVVTSAPTGSLGASLTATLGRGTYYVAARSQGGYGNVGQYTLRGTLPSAAAAPTAPEISVRLVSTELSDGSAVSFGTTTVGTPLTRTFTVTNSGGGTLRLTPLSSTVLPAGFTLVANFAQTTLAAGQSTTFSVRFNATAVGSMNGLLTVRSTDANEAAFDLRLSVAATAVSTTAPRPLPAGTPPTLVKRIVDNGASGFVKSGSWSRSTGRGVQSDLDAAGKGTGATSATWSFPGLPNGKYQVYASWTGGSTNASNAPITLYNGSQPVSTVRMNQRVASAGLVADGASWRFLGTVTVTAGRLNVRLNNAADGAVIADAIRIVQTTATAAADLAGEHSAAADLGLLAWLASRKDEPQNLAAKIERSPLPAQQSPALPTASVGLSLTPSHGYSWLDEADDSATDELLAQAQPAIGLWDNDASLFYPV